MFCCGLLALFSDTAVAHWAECVAQAAMRVLCKCLCVFGGWEGSLEGTHYQEDPVFLHLLEARLVPPAR